MAYWMGGEFTAFGFAFHLFGSHNKYSTSDLSPDFWKQKAIKFEETNMEANAGLVAGSHKRNELVRIRHDSDSGVSVFDLPIS